MKITPQTIAAEFHASYFEVERPLPIGVCVNTYEHDFSGYTYATDCTVKSIQMDATATAIQVEETSCARHAVALRAHV
jgi:hypothetical protein